ncbi:CoA ester lyase [Aureimonas sp. AU4]|uniref:HpcH/HpaI aldolase/citrate lyase family protein n=1 Tax=Aureimonas sp. AU4 TaxID=1638163 RepID=UPI0007855813|nr:CoA ester lyase [Aureimonas sp. AU4]
MPDAPLLRSALFVPAGNARALARAATLKADALLFDLEDSAAPGEKEAARERLRDHLGGTPRGRALRVVRINPLHTREGTEDLLMARAVRADAVLLPKVSGPQDLEDAGEALVQADAPETMRLWAMIETPQGVLASAAIAGIPGRWRPGALAPGPNDLALSADLLVAPGRAELMPFLGPVILAGAAYSVPVLDGVFNDFKDEAGFRAECAQGRAMGFAGKTLIHPSQIEPANQLFRPSEAEVAQAEAIRAAFADPVHAGRGVIRLDGRMVERLHLARAERLLARAALAREADQSDQEFPS